MYPLLQLLQFWLWASLASVSHFSVVRVQFSSALEELKEFQDIILVLVPYIFWKLYCLSLAPRHNVN